MASFEESSSQTTALNTMGEYFKGDYKLNFSLSLPKTTLKQQLIPPPPYPL